MSMSNNLKRSILRIVVLFFILFILVGGFLAWAIFSPNAVKVKSQTYLYIPNGAVYGDVLDSLQYHEMLAHPQNFKEISKLMDYPTHVYAGRYEIRPGMSNFDLIRLLRSGKQSPVRLVINKVRTKEDMAQLLSSYLEPDSNAFMAILNDSVFLKKADFNLDDALCAIIPNTYQFFWNTDAKSTFEKLLKERNKFWTEERRAKADSLGLSPNEVYILASIVEEETNKYTEMPLIASVYLNRLNRGMKLGADPTIKFALKNFKLKRITWDELKVKSPYNTYRHKGLPPGPICTPSTKTIDAVLKAPETSYLYFTAKADFSGSHEFEKNYAEHLKNARAYHKALDKLNIK